MSYTYSDFVKTLYKAYLEDRGIIKTLRDKIKDGSYIQDLEDDPELQNWDQINPRAIDPRKHGRSKYYPNPHNPQEGIRVFESRKRKAVKKVMECYDRKNRNGTKEHP